jgi:quercetin dioxygenase-like cupin family protein
LASTWWPALALVAACSGPRPEVPPLTPATGSAPPQVTQPSVTADAAEASQEERLAAIQKAMNELDEAAQGCWAVAAAERFDIEGELTATIDIFPTRTTPSGSVRVPTAAVTIARDTARNPRLASCLTELLAGYAWAQPLHGQAIQLPFKFRAPDGQNVIDRRLVPWKGQGKLAVAVLLDENNTNNGAASMFELAIASGGSTGQRVAERAELWYFLGPAKVNDTAVAAGDMMYVPAQHARDVKATAGDVHAMIVVAPGGREGSARAGALPTREVGAIKSGIAGPVMLPRDRAKAYCAGRGAAPSTGSEPCTGREITVAIYAQPTTIQTKALAASVLAIPGSVGVPEHVHAGETELLYVLSGTGTITVGGVAMAVAPTSVIQIPPNTKHAFAASSDFRAVQIYTPAGPEQRFKGKP